MGFRGEGHETHENLPNMLLSVDEQDCPVKLPVWA